jgi:hypothetical protein
MYNENGRKSRGVGEVLLGLRKGRGRKMNDEG